MPDQLAHFRFAQKVYDLLPPALRARIDIRSAAFRAGTFGPDPLFNDPSAQRRAEGFGLHRQPGRIALERMRAPLREGMPSAADYAAGFFCHYALDRLCHPELKSMAARGDARHVAVEIAYDRQLWLRDQADLPWRFKLSPAELQAAACMYESLGPDRLKADIQIYWKMRYFLTTGKAQALAGLPGKIHAKLEGLIPYERPDAGTIAGMGMLEARIAASIEEAAQQLRQYFEAIDKNLPLNAWCDADFAGSWRQND